MSQTVRHQFPLRGQLRLKVILDDAWIHVRASNMEPVLRIAAEGRSEERVEALYSEAMSLLGGFSHPRRWGRRMACIGDPTRGDLKGRRSAKRRPTIFTDGQESDVTSLLGG